jgi:hypothetical protein
MNRIMQVHKMLGQVLNSPQSFGLCERPPAAHHAEKRVCHLPCTICLWLVCGGGPMARSWRRALQFPRRSASVSVNS